MHDGFLGLFMGGFVLSAIFICAEYQRLGRKYRDTRILAISFWVKLAFIIIEIALAVAFGVLTRNGSKNTGAIVEWIIALVFTFWVISFAIDLWPASKAVLPPKAGRGGHHGDIEGNGNGYAGNGSNGYRGANGHEGVGAINGNGVPLRNVDLAPGQTYTSPTVTTTTTSRMGGGSRHF